MARTLIPFTTRFPSSLDLFRREMDEVFNSILAPNSGQPLMDEFTPHTNLAETEKEYEITVELPGMQPDEFNVELNENQLTITGERKHESEEKGKTYHRIERHYGKFHRVLSLGGDIDPEQVDAQYKDGVLRVTVAKVEAAKPKRIEVKS